MLDHELHSCRFVVVTAMFGLLPNMIWHLSSTKSDVCVHIQHVKKVQLNLSSKWSIPLDIVQVSLWLTSQVPDNDLYWSLKSAAHNLCW